MARVTTLVDIIDYYHKATELEKEQPAQALELYKENCMRVNPCTQRTYNWWVFFKVVFTIGFVIGFITNFVDATKPGTPLVNALFILIFGPLVAGVGLFLLLGVIGLIFIKNKTNSSKYWCSLLGHIGAARLSLKLDRPKDAIKYAKEVRKFEVGIATHIANAIISMAHEKYRQAEYALGLASSITVGGKVWLFAI
ncbi:MAG: hypothetical protein AB1779_01785 [Candidatus Thermoplasmatota archaeon]